MNVSVAASDSSRVFVWNQGMSSSKSVEVEWLSTETAPLFSVIMPVYNTEPYIRDTIASVLTQTFTSYEVVMIGGISSDKTDEICIEFAEMEPYRFRFVRQTETGVSNARNDGILAARGEYVAFLDADDLWVPEYLEVMRKLIEDFPEAKMYSCGYQCVESDGSVIIRPHQIQRGYFDYFQWAQWIHTSGLVVNRQTVISVGLFKTDYFYGEDIDLMARLALSGKVAHEPRICESYQIGVPGSLCTGGIKDLFLPVPGEPELFSATRTPSIILFHEQQILGTVMANLISGYRKEARKQLNWVNVNMKKRLCYIDFSPICHTLSFCGYIYGTTHTFGKENSKMPWNKGHRNRYLIKNRCVIFLLISFFPAKFIFFLLLIRSENI